MFSRWQRKLLLAASSDKRWGARNKPLAVGRRKTKCSGRYTFKAKTNMKLGTANRDVKSRNVNRKTVS